MNKAILIGRLTRDPELRYTSSNRAVCQFTVAIDRPFTNQASGQREADFINIVAFGNRAETMKKYLTKGSQIAISGRIQTGSYDASDGRKVYTTDVVIDEFQFLDSRASRQMESTDTNVNSNNDVTPYDFATESPSTNVETDPFKDFGDKIEIDDSDLPF